MKKGERASHKLAYLMPFRHPCRHNPGTEAGKGKNRTKQVIGRLEKLTLSDFFEMPTSCNSLYYSELQHRIFNEKFLSVSGSSEPRTET